MKPVKRAKKTSKPSPSVFRKFVRSLLELFKEELPVSRYEGGGKYLFEVAGDRAHQEELRSIAGGMTVRAAARQVGAVVVPGAGGEMRVVIDGRLVGALKPKDAKALRAVQDEVHPEPFALEVPALIKGGATKGKKEADEPFVVYLDLPLKPVARRPAGKSTVAGKSKS